jgi:hypothetical protein
MEARKYSESQIRELMALLRQKHLDLYFGTLPDEERIRTEVCLYIQDRERLATFWMNASQEARQNPQLVCDVLKMFHQGIMFGSMFRRPGSPFHFRHLAEDYYRNSRVYPLLPQVTLEDYDVIRTYIGQGGSLPLVSGRLLNDQQRRELEHLSEHIKILSEEFAEAMSDRLGQQRILRRGHRIFWPEEPPIVRFPEVCSLDLWGRFQKPLRILQVDLSQDPPLFRTVAGELFSPEELPNLEHYKAVKYVLPNGTTVYTQEEIPETPKKKRTSLAAALKRSVRRKLRAAR